MIAPVLDPFLLAIHMVSNGAFNAPSRHTLLYHRPYDSPRLDISSPLALLNRYSRKDNRSK